MVVVMTLVLLVLAIYSGIFTFGLGYRCADFIRDGIRSPAETARRRRDAGYVRALRRMA